MRSREDPNLSPSPGEHVFRVCPHIEYGQSAAADALLGFVLASRRHCPCELQLGIDMGSKMGIDRIGKSSLTLSN